jgi:hypothetical protein
MLSRGGETVGDGALADALRATLMGHQDEVLEPIRTARFSASQPSEKPVSDGASVA